MHVLVLQPSVKAFANVVCAHERAGHALPVAVSCSAVRRRANGASRVLRSLLCPRPRKVSTRKRPHHLARGDLRGLGLGRSVSWCKIRGWFMVSVFGHSVEGRVARAGWIGNSSARRFPRVFAGLPLSRFTSVLACPGLATIGDGGCKCCPCT